MVDLGLKNKVALVTGATAGIGEATAKLFASEGVRLVIVGRNKEKLSQLSDRISKVSTDAPLAVQMDLTLPDSAENLFHAVVKHFGYLDIIVNSAGGSRPLQIDAPESSWEEAMALNFTQVRRITTKFLPLMIERKFGRIINVTGTLEPKSLNAANSAKAAVHAWAKGLSIEVSKFGITINSVSPGRIMSDQIRRLYPTEEARKRFAMDNIPVGFFGQPEDVANTICFLASDLARYITGEIIHVDGGLKKSAF